MDVVTAEYPVAVSFTPADIRGQQNDYDVDRTTEQLNNFRQFRHSFSTPDRGVPSGGRHGCCILKNKLRTLARRLRS